LGHRQFGAVSHPMSTLPVDRRSYPPQWITRCVRLPYGHPRNTDSWTPGCLDGKGHSASSRTTPVLRQNLLRLVWQTFPTRLIGPRRRGLVRVGLSTSRGYRPAATVMRDSQRRGGLTAEGRDGWPRVRGCGPSRRCGTTRPGGGSGGAGRRLLEAPRSGPRRGARWA
jgi:hypothetical protein